jgi:hypothetical protein
MLGKCTNPSCSASFRYMEEGTLFRLQTDPALRLSNPKRPEYFWLCRSCSATMTLHISKEGKVVPVALPAPTHGVSHRSNFKWLKREDGLTLSDVRSSTERKRRGTGIGGR